MTDAKRSVFVTGASSGMGRACARRLSSEGFRVFASVRNESDATVLESEGIYPLLLDVTKLETVERAAAAVEGQVGPAGLQGLVNNAGVGITGPLEYLSLEALRRAFEVNLIGQLAVTQALLPLIRSGHGRIINVGSVGGSVAIPYASPICATKAAFESMSASLRLELSRWAIPVVVVAPGSIHTPAVEKLAGDCDSVVGSLPPEGRSRYEESYRRFVATFVAMERHGVAPEIMADTVHRALTVRSPKSRYPVGPKSRLLPLLARFLPAAQLDRVRERLFGLTARG